MDKFEFIERYSNWNRQTKVLLAYPAIQDQIISPVAVFAQDGSVRLGEFLDRLLDCDNLRIQIDGRQWSVAFVSEWNDGDGKALLLNLIEAKPSPPFEAPQIITRDVSDRVKRLVKLDWSRRR